jgi:glycosyltransferase involved in cell wall biosynthesis
MENVTIAIPIYNCEKFIEKTMLSALNQTFKSIEILIIDDKGSDGSMNIIYHLQQNHPKGKNIRIVSHEKNKGVAAARNTAIDNAKGDYLFFLDSDDLIAPTCIEILHKQIHAKQTDIAIASSMKFYENSNKKLINKKYPDIVIKGKYKLAESPFLSQISSVWNILFPITTLKEEGIRFRNVDKFEDILFITEFLLTINSCAFSSEITYNYNIRQDSLCQYYERDIIPLNEILKDVPIRIEMKEICKKNRNMPYIPNLCASMMKRCIESATAILNQQKKIKPPAPTTIIKEILAYPLTFKEIIKFKNKRTINLFFWMLGKLPYCGIVLFLSFLPMLIKLVKSK